MCRPGRQRGPLTVARIDTAERGRRDAGSADGREDYGILEKLPEWRAGDVDVKHVIQETVAQVGDNDLPGLSAEMAYPPHWRSFRFCCSGGNDGRTR